MPREFAQFDRVARKYGRRVAGRVRVSFHEKKQQNANGFADPFRDEAMLIWSLLCLVVAASTGIMIFGGIAAPQGWWLHALFLCSVAGFVFTLVRAIVQRAHAEYHEESADPERDGASDRRAKERSRPGSPEQPNRLHPTTRR